jgi:hypothetical protein
MRPTSDVLNELLLYIPETGELWWHFRDVKWFKDEGSWNKWNSKNANKKAFTANSRGYNVGRVFGKNYSAHHIIWCMEYGYWPKQLDHVDGNPSNNRLANLREVDQKENRKNCKTPSNNTSGMQGVSWNSRNNNWTAQIKVNRVKHHLGCFKTKEEALVVRKRAEAEYGFHANHGRM